MKFLRGLLFLVLVTAFATSNAVTNRRMTLQQKSLSHFTESKMKSFLDEFKTRTKCEVVGTHSYQGKATLGFRNSYKA